MKNKNHGCAIGCAFLAAAILLIITLAEHGYSRIAGCLVILLFVSFFVIKIRLIRSYDPNAKEEIEKPDESTRKGDAIGYIPEFEMRYRKSNGEESVRKIAVVSIGELLDAYCFLKNCVCTFAFSRIKECVDLSTGELVGKNFRTYYAKSRASEIKPIDVFDFYYWEKIRYSSFLDLPDGISGFEINQKFMMDIVTFKYGERKEEFVCKRVVENEKGSERFCVELVDSSNKTLYVGMSKIISVDGIEDFGEFLTQKFYESKADKDEKKQDSV